MFYQCLPTHKACLSKYIIGTIFVFTVIIGSGSASYSAVASPLCKIENFRNIRPAHKPIPHLQWRRCRIAGKPLYYLRIYHHCGRKTCTLGWMRAARRGRHFISTYDHKHIVRTIRFHFPSEHIMKLHARSEYVRHKHLKDWNLKFRRY